MATGRGLDSVAQTVLGRPATREVIPRDPASSVRWRVHDYPDPLARWNFHPEIEIHLITASTGRYIIGDAVGRFAPGHLCIVGANVPHDWISDLAESGSIAERDVVLQFDAHWLKRCQQALPELDDLNQLLARSAHGVEYLGATAARAAVELKAIGQERGTARVVRLLALLHLLNDAPPDDFRMLSRGWVVETEDPRTSAIIGRAIDYVFANLDSEVRLSQASQLAGMSESAFSRYFRNASGQTFSEMVTRLRLAHACQLLESTSDSVASIAGRVGYANLSNFNRRFRARYDCTPREYRRDPQRAGARSGFAQGGVEIPEL